ncbi:heterokaryon incompatibility protein-domain-containing protein [Bipolaris maydis]|nr:heterokaryon incompatibility protein-domain-containing protein [Bipolaris maydis]
MRLLNTESLELSCPYVPSEVPDYAILSHRWSPEEVTFADINSTPILHLQSQMRTKKGFAKIQGACKLARNDGYTWIWIDSCCIDKSSSAELQEAINSMWRYYAESNICYVYLEDVLDSEAGWGPMFAKSQWFTRGWTLQELIAPTCVEFFAENWAAIGTKFERYKQIADITSIDSDLLIRVRALDDFSTAERLSWASHRNVTREEDETYSLMGLFDVNMPLLYGEGREKAFVRLQEAIYNATADHSMFLFRYSQHKFSQPLLANSPKSFCDSWRTQAHEQIMTTVTSSRNEVSTILPILAYREISSKLEFLDGATPRVNVTHVAVLNHTLKKYPQGALCLLLQRRSDLDSSLRLQALPVILPDLGDFVSRLQKTKLLICPGPGKLTYQDPIDAVFSIHSDLFHVEAWDVKGSKSHSLVSAQTGQNSEFKIRTISCGIVCSQDSELLLTIRLIQMNEIWSIKEITERRKYSRERNLHTLFLSTVLADRCAIHFPDGKILSVKLRRLPGSARTPEGFVRQPII